MIAAYNKNFAFFKSKPFLNRFQIMRKKHKKQQALEWKYYVT